MLLPFVTTLLIVNYVLLEKAVGSTVYDASVNSNSDLLTHPRITENCRHVFEGNEGTAIQGFKLRQVFVATTPGLLTPHISNSQSSSYEPEEYVRFCSFRDFLKSGIADYLKTLTIKEKFRGNVIKPDFKIFYSMPDEENCQKQILSLFGLSQLINLGKYLLKSYNDKLVSLDTVQPHPGLAVTYGDETFFHSLSALLYGLLTEKQFIYTHIKKSSYDFSEEAQLQNTYQDLHYFMEQSYIKEYHLFKNSKVNPDDVANPLLFDPNESSKSAISHLSNSLCPTFSDHSSQTVTVTHQDVDNIFNASDLHNIYLTNSLVFQTYSIARTFALRQLVKIWLSPSTSLDEPNSSIRKNNDLKIVTIDDLFILSFLTALNVPGSQHVSPASRLIIESFLPISTNSSPHSEDLISKQLTEINASTIQETSTNNINGGTLNSSVIFETVSEKLVNEEMLEKENLKMSLDKTSNSVFSSRRSSSTFSVDDVHKLSNSRENPDVYVRILYDGRVVTSYIPGCEMDPYITLGLCSLTTFDILLDKN